MSLTIAELSSLEDDIMKELPNRMTEILSKLNRSGRLEEFLELIEMENLLGNENDIYSYKDGKIVIVGASDIKEEVLRGIAKSLGLNKDRFEFCLDYGRIQKYDFRKMQYAPQYRTIIVGPMPHSGHGKGDSGSIISELEKSSAYPRCEKLISGSELKITKSNFREKLEQLIKENYI